MNDELKSLLDEIDLNDISDLDDITSESVDDILSKYDLDSLQVDDSSADRILDEAYAMVNNENYDINRNDNDSEDLNKLHEDIYNEVESTIKETKKLEEASDDDKTKKSNLNVQKKNDKKERKKKNKNKVENNDVNKEENNLENEFEDDIDKNKNVNEDINEDATQENDEDDTVENISFFDKVGEGFKKLFYNVQDPEYEKKQRKLERKELRKKEAQAAQKEKAKEEKSVKAEEKKKKAAEDAAAKKKEKDEQNKRKAEKKKKAAEKKKQEKEERKKAAENEPVGRINKLGATVVFMFVGLIVLATILYATKGLKKDYEKESRIYFAQGNYELAYLTLIKDKDVKEDSEYYEQVKLVQTLNKQLSYYSSNITLLDRNKALDDLLRGIEIYDKNKVNAKRISVDKEFSAIFDTIKKYLKEEYKLSITEARTISKINNEEEYSEKIDEVCKASKK